MGRRSRLSREDVGWLFHSADLCRCLLDHEGDPLPFFNLEKTSISSAESLQWQRLVVLDGAVLRQHKSRRPVPLPARLHSSSPPRFSSTLASWATAKVSVASHPTRGRGSACPPLSVQPPSPPAPAPAAAPGGRIAYLLQIKCPHIICFNRDTFERISTDWICNARLGACFFSTVISPNEIPGHF